MVQRIAPGICEACMSREIAFDLIYRVEKDDAYANLLLPELLNKNNVDSRDAGFAQELAFGTIRNKLLYERFIELASGRKISDIELITRIVLLLGIHQLLSMRVSDYAAINETVNLAKTKCSKAAVGFVNAVLRKLNSKTMEEWTREATEKLTPQDTLALQTSHPAWIAKSLKLALDSRNLGDTHSELLECHQKPAKVSLVALPGLCEVSSLRRVDSATNPSPIGAEIQGNPSQIEEVKNGFARVQDQGSQLVALALTSFTLEIEDRIWLDMCAGPGGKAALLASQASLLGLRLECNELLNHRSKLVSEALSKFKNVVVTTGDGRAMHEKGARFTRILLDAPCTGLGSLRRRPEARWRKTPNDLTDLVLLQRQLLEAAWKSLVPGGVLAYVTCSPHLSETTAQISWFESKFTEEFELVNTNTLLNAINPELGLDERFSTTQLWPHLNNTDAMFLAIFKKTLD